MINPNYFYGRVSNTLDGWSANRTEYKWSKLGDMNFLCKVRISLLFSFIIVMDRTNQITEQEFDELNMDDFNFGFEKKLDSFGKDKHGNIIVVDYA